MADSVSELEVMTILSGQHLSVVNHFKVYNGAIIQTHSWEFKRNNQEEDEEVLSAALEQLFMAEEEVSQQFVSNIEIPGELLPENVQLSVPKRGDKKHLVELSVKNCKALLTEKLYTQNFKKRRSHAEIMVDELQKELPNAPPSGSYRML